MQLPASMLDTTALVLSEQAGPQDALGQSVRGWQPAGPPIPAAHFPAGERITRQAQLRGVTVAREVYLQGSVNLNPQANRLLIAGITYRITLVNEWDGFTVAGLVTEGR